MRPTKSISPLNDVYNTHVQETGNSETCCRNARVFYQYRISTRLVSLKLNRFQTLTHQDWDCHHLQQQWNYISYPQSITLPSGMPSSKLQKHLTASTTYRFNYFPNLHLSQWTNWKVSKFGTEKIVTYSATCLPFWVLFENWQSKGIYTSIWIGDL